MCNERDVHKAISQWQLLFLEIFNFFCFILAKIILFKDLRCVVKLSSQ